MDRSTPQFWTLELPARGGAKGLLLLLSAMVIGSTALAIEQAHPNGAASVSVIQEMIDLAPEGAVLVIPPGSYIGNLKIEKPITIDGQNGVTIDANGSGTVIQLFSNNVTLRNLRLVNSGEDHNAEDAGIQIRGSGNVVKDVVIENTLFGMTLEKSDSNVIRRNKISSRPLDLGLRGDALKLWYSNGNKVEDNEVVNSRDIVLWYSRNNYLTGNSSSGGRYGLHFMYSVDNVVENNRFFDNSVGISLMYSVGDIVRNNYVAKSTGATGTCVSLKEASSVTIENNDILYCATGIYLDLSPFEPGAKDLIIGNRISYNDIAISFLNDWRDNVFKDNTLRSNMTEVVVFGGGSAHKNEWDGNTWESYEGFDRNQDGVGDTPQRLYNYAGLVWMEVPNTRFFKDTPILEVLDFLDRLAPFSEPRLLLEDKHPLMGKEKAGRS